MRAIYNNPYRLLGVYSTSPQKEVVANQGKVKAFLKVGRQVAFPLDLNGLLPEILRSEQSVADAISKLALPKEQLKYAQFWFSKCTQFDEIACGKLTNGDINGAVEIWKKKATASSLQNLLVCALICNQLEEAIGYAQTLYSSYSNDFVKMVLGDNALATSDNLVHDFLNIICEEFNPNQVLGYVTNVYWKEYIGNISTKPIFDNLISAIEICKSSKGKGSGARLDAGTKLMNGTKNDLAQLNQFVSASDLQYQMIADKLGLEILQCGIDYYNDSEDDDAAFKAMELQKYAQSIVVGKMAKDRCDENVRILENIISNMPPLEVISEHKKIQSALNRFKTQPDLIAYSIQLIKACAPYIVSIKERLDNKHKYYLKISTVIVNNALGNIIAEVNEAQDKEMAILKNTLIEAWRTQLYLDKFDLEPDYKDNRYKECRKALYGIIENCKGFENSRFSRMYQYGCGWCNDLNVSDVDLRTDDDFFASCNTISLYQMYLQKFPSGKHVREAKSEIESIAFHAAKTIEDYRNFINNYPKSKLCKKAQESINEMVRIENEQRNHLVLVEKTLLECKTTEDVVKLYRADNLKSLIIQKCSTRAFELAINEEDYKTIMSIFGANSEGGRKAKDKIKEIECKREEDEKRKQQLKKWILWIGILLVVVFLTYLIWGVRGAAVCCTIMTILSALLALGSIGDGCGKSFLIGLLALIFGFSASGLSDLAKRIEYEKKSMEMYNQILESPSVDLCVDYLYEFDYTENANAVRELWLNLLIKKSNNFDYASYEYAYDSSTPTRDIQNYINKNHKNVYAEKANSFLAALCDSLYNVAVYNSTIDGWKHYRQIVPTEYHKDSNQKIEEIENMAWSTESKAWRQASTENSISAYEKYKSLYPNGKHIKACEKKIIDLEVARIYAGDHGTLPEMDKIGYGGGSTSYITVTNSTAYTLTLLYSGPDSKRLVLSPRQSSSIRLKNGSYKVAASVSASNVGNYAGNEQLKGGEYSVEYYISTYRY